MDDLISRQGKLLKNYHFVQLTELTDECIERIADAVVNKMPTAEKKGEWIGIDDEPCEVWECDKCGHIVEVDATLKLPNYCENCGARMEE